MTCDIRHLPKGWQPMARELLEKAEREFPGIVFEDISAKAGWLSVDFDKHSVPVGGFARALKLCQGYSTVSWNVCVECGSHHGYQRAGHILPICDGCL